MVTEEQLAALDLTLWLGSTERAAEVDFSNQSTVSRRHHKVLRQFGIELKRTKSELEVSGDPNCWIWSARFTRWHDSNADGGFACKFPSGFKTALVLFHPMGGR